MKQKFVKFTAECSSLGSSADFLKKGKIYRVISVEQNNYVLAEYPDMEFASAYFSDVPVHIGFSNAKPAINHSYKLYKLTRGRLIWVETSTVMDISCLNNNVFVVRTKNSVYIVKVD